MHNEGSLITSEKHISGAIPSIRARNKNVTEEFAAAALDLAKERMQRAKEDAEYANSQYESDMSREKLYAEVDKQLK